ncbi:MAG: carbohydrate ABC transporter permease [Anaerolineae bacterium]
MPKLSRWQQSLYQFLLVLVGLFVLIPIWGLAEMAFDADIQGWPLDFRIVPRLWSLDVFANVWAHTTHDLSFLGLLRNSLIVSGGAALLSVAFGASMAYAFARLRFPGQRAGLFALLFGTLLPPVALMTPLFILLSLLQVRTTLFGLIVVYTAFAMPFCVWNMRSAFQSVPRELEEAAFIDGADFFGAFWRVTLPLALPSIAVAALVAFLAGYSEFAMAWLFIDNGENVTLAMSLAGMVGPTGASWNMIAATAMLMCVPVVLIFVVFQKYLLSRFLLGGVEGE